MCCFTLLEWDTGTEGSTIEEINSIVILHIPTGMILFLLYDTKRDVRRNVQAAHLCIKSEWILRISSSKWEKKHHEVTLRGYI